MTSWKNTTLEMVYGDGIGGPGFCDVIINNNKFQISHLFKGNHLVYNGIINHEGIVNLTSQIGSGVLKLDPEQEIAAGEWRRGVERGTWIVKLPGLEWPEDDL